MKDKKIALFMLPLLTQGGGAEKYFIQLARNLTEMGIQTDIVTMNESFFRKFTKLLYFFVYRKWYQNIDISGRESKEAVMEKMGKAKWIKSSWKNLRKILNEYNVIYSKNELSDLTLLKVTGYRKLPPIIVGVHTPIFYPVTDSFISRLHNKLYLGFVYRWLLSGTASIHLSNKFQKNLVDKKFKIKSNLIYYPFSTKEIGDNAKNNISDIKFDKKTNIIFVGRLSEQKGINSLVNIINNLGINKEIIDDLAINIFGSGTKAEEELIKKTEREYKFVKFFGHIENKFIPDILSRQNLLITTAKWETLPFNVLEAQAMGLPVIAFDIPGPNDIIEDSKTGFLVKDEKEFLDRIIDVISGKAGFKKEEIINTIEDKFNPNKIYDQLAGMFESNL